MPKRRSGDSYRSTPVLLSGNGTVRLQKRPPLPPTSDNAWYVDISSNLARSPASTNASAIPKWHVWWSRRRLRLRCHAHHAAYRQAWPDLPDNAQAQETINAQDLQAPEKGKERGFMFRRVVLFLFLFLFCFTGLLIHAQHHFHHVRHHHAPIIDNAFIAPLPIAPVPSSSSQSTFDSLLRHSYFDSNPLSISLSLLLLVNYKIMYKRTLVSCPELSSSCLCLSSSYLCVHSKSPPKLYSFIAQLLLSTLSSRPIAN